MSAEITDVTEGTLTFKVSGMLKRAEVVALQRQAGQLIDQHKGKVRFLLLMENVLGMEKDADWGDVSFPARYDKFIEKIAIVGQKQWEPAALLFTGKGVRRVAIEYFEPAQLNQARAWLAAPTSKSCAQEW